MDNFVLFAPTKFVFGKDTEQQAGELVKENGAKKVMIHYGGGSAEKSGLLGRIRESLKSAGIGFCELGGVAPNPREELVRKGIDLCRKEKVDMILSVGGGSVFDSAKVIAAGSVYDCDVMDLLGSKDNPFFSKVHVEKSIPIGSVVTIPASGSEANTGGGIYSADGVHHPIMSESLRAKFTILNPELTYTLPPYQTAAGCVDIISHSWEKYLTRTPDVDFLDGLIEATMKTIVKNAPIVLKEPENYGARANIMWAATISSHDFTAIGRMVDFSTHMMEWSLARSYNCTHGAAIAVMMPAFARYMVKNYTDRFVQLAVNVFGAQMDASNPEKTALDGIDRMEAFFKSIGMPTSFKELGAKEEDIPTLVANCPKPNQGKLGFAFPLEEAQIAEVYKLACK